MDYLFAKVNDRRNKYRILLSDVTVYENIELNDVIEYQPSHVPDDEQWFFIDLFSEKLYCIDLLKKEAINAIDYLELNKAEPEKIAYLISYQDENSFYFQRVFPSRVLKNKKFVHIEDDVKIRNMHNAIVINDVPDAIYKKDDDRLYFRKFETITPIFKGIDELYREATDEEVDEFLGLGFINLQGEYSTEKVKKANRKRIALAMESLNRYTSEQKDTIFNYTNNYFPHLRFNGTSFEVRNEEDLKNLLYGIEQRFYTTVATYEKRCASAVYAVLVCAWSEERFINALLKIGKNVGNKFEYKKINHMATYIYPLGLAIVYNGNHSILSGILKGEGVIQANQTYDLEPTYDYMYFDGVYFRNKDNDEVIYKVRRFEIGILYEIGRLLAENGIR